MQKKLAIGIAAVIIVLIAGLFFELYWSGKSQNLRKLSDSFLNFGRHSAEEKNITPETAMDEKEISAESATVAGLESDAGADLGDSTAQSLEQSADQAIR